MNDHTRLIFEQLGISLLLGLLVGLQRQHRRSLIAGLRTFPLISILGTLAAAFDLAHPSGGWMTACGFIGLTIVVAISMVYEMRREDADVGITTEAAILLMYLVGAYVVLGDRIVAIAVGAGVAVLLQFKPELHGFAARLGDEDLRAIMTFALISGVILPILPNTTYDLVSPLNVLNPFEVWMMVVLMVGISLGGYLAYKFLGQTAGILLGGLLGGAISSTATTLTYARRSSEGEASASLAAVVVAIAATVVYVRVIIEIAVVAPGHWEKLVPPVAIMMGANAAAAVLAWVRIRRSSAEMPKQQNPTELKSAMVFAALFAGVLLALAAAKTYLGGQGLYAVAALSGLTDMDAITLSSAKLVTLEPELGGIEPSQAWRLIVIATMANLSFKWVMCLLLGASRFSREVGTLFAVPLVAGGVLLWFWP